MEDRDQELYEAFDVVLSEFDRQFLVRHCKGRFSRSATWRQQSKYKQGNSGETIGEKTHARTLAAAPKPCHRYPQHVARAFASQTRTRS